MGLSRRRGLVGPSMRNSKTRVDAAMRSRAGSAACLRAVACQHRIVGMEGDSMALEIVPFAGGHLDAAALLATRHRRERRRAAALPERFEEPAAARSVLESVLAREDAVGVVALRGSRLVGYLLGTSASIDPGHPFAAFRRARAAEIQVAGHAVVLSDTREVYGALYTALAAQWLTAGLDAHYVQVPAGDQLALACWFALGFGHET